MLKWLQLELNGSGCGSSSKLLASIFPGCVGVYMASIYCPVTDSASCVIDPFSADPTYLDILVVTTMPLD